MFPQCRLQPFQKDKSAQRMHPAGKAGEKERIGAEAAGEKYFLGLMGKAVGIEGNAAHKLGHGLGLGR